jgi:hypothetical protein
MDFNSFLGKLDESNSSGFRSFSGKTLFEDGAPGAATADGGSQSIAWAYIPEKQYGRNRHLVIEHTDNKWELLYLQGGGTTSAANKNVYRDADDEVLGFQGGPASGAPVGEARDLEKLVNYLMSKPLNEGAGSVSIVGAGTFTGTIEGANPGLFDGWRILRSTGKTDFGTVLKECVQIVQNG